MNYDVVAIATDELAMAWTPAEEGLWHRLIRHAWINGSIPADPAGLALICRVTKRTFLTAWPKLKKSFQNDEKDPSRLTNKKLEIERTFQSKKHFTYRANAELRWKRQKSKEDADAIAFQLHSNCNAHLIKSNHIEENSLPEDDSLLENNSKTVVLPRTKKRPRPAAKTPAPLIADFEVTEAMVSFAAAEGGLSLEECYRETAVMLDHFRGKGEAKADWQATWRNWMRNSRKYNGNVRQNPKPEADDPDRESRAMKRIKEILDA